MLTKAKLPRTASMSDGFTILEVIVAIVVLGIIMVPLTMATVGMFTNSRSAEEMLNRNNDAQRIAAAWTTDVQSVLPGGVNTPGKECMPASPSPEPESLLITFSWTSNRNDGTGNEKIDMSSSWSAVGIGRDVSLVRRECINGTFASQQFLAKRIGEPGKQGIDVIHGPAKTAAHADPHTERSFCPREIVADGIVGRTCTIVVDGSWKYDLQVSRRVPEVFDSSSLIQAPAAPRNLTASPRNGSISTRYESPVMQPGQPEVDLYRVRARPAAGGPAVEVVVPAGNDPMFTTVDGLSNGAGYFVMVQAHNSVGWGDWTPEVGPVVPVATEPNAPTNVIAVAGNGEATISFKPPENDGGSPITSWHIYGKDTNGNWLNLSGGVVSPRVYNVAGGAGPAVTAVGDRFEAVFSGLTNGVTYHFVVAGVNGVAQNTANPNPPFILRTGEGLISAESNDVTPFGVPEPADGVEARGENPSTDMTKPQVRVRWEAPTDLQGTTITGYRIRTYRGVGQTNALDPDGAVVSPNDVGCATVTTCEYVADLPITAANQSDHYYRFTIATIGTAEDDTEVESEESDFSSPSGDRRMPPALADHVRPSRSPDGVSTAPVLTRTGNNITASFPAPFDGGEDIEVVRVQVRSKPTAGGPWSGWTVQTAPAVSAGSHVAASFTSPGERKEIEVRVAPGNRGEWTTSTAESDYRFSALSPAASIVHVGTPLAVTNVGVERPNGSFGRELTVSWSPTADTGGAPTTYTVTCTDSSNQQTVSSGVTGSTTKITGLRDGRATTCRVQAVNSAGSSASQTGAVREPYGECRMYAEADTFVNADSKNANYSTWTVLEVNPSDERQTLLRFPIQGGSKDCLNKPSETLPTTSQVRADGATVTMNATGVDNVCCWPASIYANVRFYRYDNTWNETTATWNNTRHVDWSGGVASNTVRIDETGTYTFNLSSGMLRQTQLSGRRTLLLARENGSNYSRVRKISFPSRRSNSTNQAQLFYYFNSEAP